MSNVAKSGRDLITDSIWARRVFICSNVRKEFLVSRRRCSFTERTDEFHFRFPRWPTFGLFDCCAAVTGWAYFDVSVLRSLANNDRFIHFPFCLDSVPCALWVEAVLHSRTQYFQIGMLDETEKLASPPCIDDGSRKPWKQVFPFATGVDGIRSFLCVVAE